MAATTAPLLLLFWTVILELRAQSVATAYNQIPQNHKETKMNLTQTSYSRKLFYPHPDEKLPPYLKYVIHGKTTNGTARKDKVEYLGGVLKGHVRRLRQTFNRKVELVFLVDASASVGKDNFLNELKFVKKLLADFTVDQHTCRVSVITFSSRSRVERPIDHLTVPRADRHKCSLLEEAMPRIEYTGGGTFTLGAFLEAQQVLRAARTDAQKAIFLITDGYSNGGDPRPAAASLRKAGVEIFTIGIKNGNFRELWNMSSEPKEEHTYILDSFEEFEALARRALHEDLHSGYYVIQALMKCNNLCDEKHKCCDDKASCRCGTHTGKYECICQAGFYGNGLKGGCTACPPGTFKNNSDPGDRNTCKKCPDRNHVSPAGSTSIDKCTCRHGYRSRGTYACAEMVCPELELPENGYFINNQCRNVINAACGIRCNPGYKISGSSFRFCQENATWTGRLTRCTIKRCPPLNEPKNGNMVCTSQTFTFGTSCHLTCNLGYKLVGSKRRNCLAIADWDGIHPHCREVHCDELPELTDGRVKPDTCTTQRSAYGTICRFSCSKGYKLVGPHNRQCTRSGEWTPQDERLKQDNMCIDVSPPLIKCPGDIESEADYNENTAKISWTVPTAVDNSAYLPTMTVIPAMVPPVAIPIGRTTITYVAEDSNRNKAKCTFHIAVKDTQPPRIDKCASPPPFVRRKSDAVVTWEEPEFSDNSAEPVVVKRSHKPGIFRLGRTTVVYAAYDGHGNNNTCNINVIVKEHACANPVTPYNGMITCVPQSEGVACTLQCRDGYGFVTEPAEKYFCDYDTGKWEPPEKVPFPDCSSAGMSNHVIQTTKLVFKSSASCEDRLLLNQMESSFDRRIQMKLEDYCHPNMVCKVKTFDAECIDNEILNEVEILTNQIDHSFPYNRILRRKRRSVSSSDVIDGNRFPSEPASKPEAPPEKNSVLGGFKLEGSLDTGGEMITAEQQQDLHVAVSDVMEKLKRDASTGIFDDSLADKRIAFKKFFADGEEARFTCHLGSVLRERDCVNCPIGTFFNVVSETCEGCQVGSYQPDEAQFTCMVCPSNTSTTDGSSKSINQCKGQCLPGSFSEDGLDPCETCPIGQFQTAYAQTSCRPCAGIRTTWRRGTRKPEECGVLCAEGFVSKTGLQACFPCPRGYFQPEKGRSSCFLCPGNVKTNYTGSTSISDCATISNLSEQPYNVIPTSALVINECFKEPCQNGADCVSLEVGFTCECLPGWTGIHCEIEIDECLSGPCYNNGTCVDYHGGFNCSCSAGFAGEICEANIDECASNPCSNNATCYDGIDQFYCECQEGFNGTLCEIDLDDCESNPCQNGGICMDGIAEYECMCVAGFAGLFCETDLNECVSAPCRNGGICHDEINSFRCACVAGYSGDQCEVDFDECSSSPCLNEATCFDHVNSFVCHCRPSYSGIQCETQLNSTFDLTFDSSGVTDYIVLDDVMPNLTMFTIAFWMRTRDTSNYGTALSYATADNDNTLTIMDYGGFVFYVNGQKQITDVTANDGIWHHLVITWSMLSGVWRIHKDGVIEDEGRDLGTSSHIPGGGTLIVGQEQDRPGGDFSAAESFVGSVSKMNIWDHVLGEEEIAEIRNQCEYIGSVVAWPDFLGGLSGRVARKDSDFCKGCDPPAGIRDGRVEWNGTEFQSVAEYSCDLGYELLDGPRHRHCRIDSTWHGEEPVCERVNCRFPETIVHGSVKEFDYRYGSTITYQCAVGYRLSSNHSLFCNADGIWEGNAPRCLEIACLRPTLSPHLNALLRNHYRPGDTTRFTCQSGYRLVGAKVIQCTDEGTWNNDLPECEQVFCTHPPRIDHGTPSADVNASFNVGAVVRYLCHHGYRIRGLASIRCLNDGSWTSFKPTCHLVQCDSTGKISNGLVIGRDFTFGNIIKHTCVAGYRLVGVAVLECLSTGRWNASSPRCEATLCPEPYPIVHGAIDFNHRRVNATRIYKCDEGYLLKGTFYQNCMEDGRWSNSPATCEQIRCKPPESVKHATIVGDAHYFGNFANYSCENGFVLIGKPDLRCGVGGEWVDPAPTCAPIECPSPAKPEHGHLIGESHLFQDIIEYTCDSGYVLLGVSQRTCLANGTWSSSSPSCKRRKCSDPIKIPNGIHSQSTLDTGSVIRYTCNTGYEANGKATRTCKDDGTWTGPVPKCNTIKCLYPKSIQYGRYVAYDNGYGSTLDYVCDQGYELSGTSSRKCSSDKQWSGSDPTCLKLLCEAPPQISHGQYDGSLEVGSELLYKCEPGFVLNGENMRRCLEDKTWSGTSPRCEPVECNKPSVVISNGRMTSELDTFNFLSSARYMCDEGYFIDGPAVRTCRADGEWDDTIPVCQRVVCAQPERPRFGNIEGQDFRFQESVSYNCKAGYELVGSTRRVCRSDGNWDGTVPSCVRIECPRPKQPDNGNVNLQGVFYQNYVKYGCDYGFKLIGLDVRVCQKDRQWSGSEPQCTQIECGEALWIEHAIADKNYSSFGEKVKYRCIPGYVLSHGSVLQCSVHGNYTGSVPSCVKVQCPVPHDIAHGSRRWNGTTFEDTATYSCDDAYRLVGDRVSKCREIGEWSAFPQCEQILCPAPKQIPNARLDIPDVLNVSSTVTYTCHTAYKLQGQGTLNCLSGGNWSSKLPNCEAVSCGEVERIEYGTVETSGYNFNDKAIYSCQDNYRLIGSSERTCNQDGEWTGTGPYCEEVECHRPTEVAHASLMLPGKLTVGSRVQYTCDEGYELHDVDELSCLESGIWSSDPPLCNKVRCPIPVLDFGYMVPRRNNQSADDHGKDNEEYLFEMRVNFDCELGYERSGSPHATCQANATWFPDIPVCSPVRCHLPVVENADINTPNGLEFGQRIVISCTEGYELEGTSQIHCTADRSWSDEIPRCKPVVCPHPEFTDGKITVVRSPHRGVGYPLGITLKFHCALGTEIVGEDELTCESDRKWSADIPACSPVMCAEPVFDTPHAPMVIDVNKSIFQFEEAVLFGCELGYRVTGNNMLHCDGVGQWNGTMPTCTLVECARPLIPHGRVRVPLTREYDPVRITYDMNVTVECEAGYASEGEHLVTCTYNGHFYPDFPRCTLIKCPTPVIPNGDLIYRGDSSEFTEGKRITFNCEKGYTLEGNKRAHCLGNGTWSSVYPTCVKTRCPNPHRAGMIVSVFQEDPMEPLSFGDEIHITCESGYELNRVSTMILCTANGEWSDILPECQRVTCPFPLIPNILIRMNGSVYDDLYEFHFEDHVEVQCRDGYRLEGENTMVCSSDGSWPSSLPECHIIQCPVLSIADAILDTTVRTFGTKVGIACNLGFEIFGDNTLKCGADGSWAGEMPSCAMSECPSPNIEHGRSIGTSIHLAVGYAFGDIVEFHCDTGYYLEGDSHLLCMPDMTWSGPMPNCNVVICQEPDGHIENGQIRSITPPSGQEYSYGTKLELSCLPGFHPGSEAEIVCTSLGTWSTTLPECIQNTCQYPTIQHGSAKGRHVVSEDKYVFGDTVKYKCNPGYNLIGEPEAFCAPDGQWTTAIPTCDRLHCPAPNLIDNGDIRGTSYRFEDVLTIVCDEGYEIHGSPTIACLPDTNWSQMPFCRPVVCFFPPDVANGEYMATGFSYGNKARYACHSGYELIGEPDHRCQADKSWGHDLPTCVPVKCLDPLPPALNAHPPSQENDTYEFGDEVMYSCAEGFVTNLPHLVQCLASGRWSTTETVCTLVSCGPPPHVWNGRVVGSKHSFGSQIRYQCNRGYEMKGNATSSCQASGNWDGVATLCDRVICPEPQQIEQSYFQVNGVHVVHTLEDLNNAYQNGLGYGDSIRYACKEGHELRGQMLLRCLANGNWSADLPSCEKVTCKTAPVLQHASVEWAVKTFGERLKVVCDEGYELQDADFVQCFADGTWDTSAITCALVSCPLPDIPTSGNFLGRKHTYESTVQYICDTGFEMIGENNRTCLSTKTWSGQTPACQPVTCQPPDHLENGFLFSESNRYSYNSTIRYGCNSGYKLTGSITRTCRADRQWTGQDSQCQIIHCPSPSAVTNAHYLGTDTEFGSSVDYDCIFGFKMTGRSTLICQADGNWSDDPPVCKKVTCGPPRSPSHGYYDGSDYTFNATVSYHCDKGYTLEGRLGVICQGDGHWSGSAPVCTLKVCPPPPKSKNGLMVGDDFGAGSTVQFMCDEGYRLLGNDKLECEEGDRWSGEVPKCDRVSCGIPPVLNSSLVDEQTYDYGDMVTFQCLNGYILQGDPTITCLANGTWSDIAATCSPVRCSEPPIVRHATTHGNSHLFDEFIFYRCKEGYDLRGNNILRCGYDGKWKGNLPICRMVTCGTVPTIAHASTIVTRNTYLSKAMYECNRGYVLRGNPMLECKANGTWMYHRKPICEPVNCGPPQPLTNGGVKVPAHTLQNIASYYCSEGFHIHGNPVLQCGSTGSWNGTAPECKSVTCPTPVAPNNGHVEGVNHSYSSEVLFSCDRGYQLVGDPVRTCEATGSWSGRQPTCDLVYCGRPETPANSNMSVLTGHHYHSLARFQCLPGYEMVGNNTIVCMDDGQWSYPSPICIRQEVEVCPPPPPLDHTHPVDGEFFVGDTIVLLCVEGYVPSGDDVAVTCQDDLSWTLSQSTCQKISCGPPQSVSSSVVVFGHTFLYGDHVLYMCLRGQQTTTDPVLTCRSDGTWDNAPDCRASCRYPCMNGGICIGRNRCKCASGYGGRHCEQAICILPCLNGGKCTGPYKCACSFGHAGVRCEKPVCSTPCENGGRCIAPNRCMCPHKFKPPFCKSNRVPSQTRR